jgi:hypothetical protein
MKTLSVTSYVHFPFNKYNKILFLHKSVYEAFKAFPLVRSAFQHMYKATSAIREKNVNWEDINTFTNRDQLTQYRRITAEELIGGQEDSP